MGKVGLSFNFLAATTNKNYAILQIVPKFMIRHVA